MPKSTGDNAHLSRLVEQLDRLAADGCCPPGDMVVFPVPQNSGSLSDLMHAPGVTVERVGPDVVRVRRAS